MKNLATFLMVAGAVGILLSASADILKLSDFIGRGTGDARWGIAQTAGCLAGAAMVAAGYVLYRRSPPA